MSARKTLGYTFRQTVDETIISSFFFVSVHLLSEYQTLLQEQLTHFSYWRPSCLRVRMIVYITVNTVMIRIYGNQYLCLYLCAKFYSRTLPNIMAQGSIIHL